LDDDTGAFVGVIVGVGIGVAWVIRGVREVVEVMEVGDEFSAITRGRNVGKAAQDTTRSNDSVMVAGFLIFLLMLVS
jgi:hypothetical protein